MANDVLAVRMPREEKRALRVLAAEADMNLTDYVLHVLRSFTAVESRALSLAKSVSEVGQNIPRERGEPVNAHN